MEFIEQGHLDLLNMKEIQTVVQSCPGTQAADCGREQDDFVDNFLSSVYVCSWELSAEPYEVLNHCYSPYLFKLNHINKKCRLTTAFEDKESLAYNAFHFCALIMRFWRGDKDGALQACT